MAVYILCANIHLLPVVEGIPRVAPPVVDIPAQEGTQEPQDNPPVLEGTAAGVAPLVGGIPAVEGTSAAGVELPDTEIMP